MKLRRLLFKIPIGLIFLGLLFFLLIVIAIVIDLTRETNSFSAWVFSFVTNWSGVLSAAAALIMAIAAFAAIRENRRSRALDNIHTWARETLRVLMALPKEVNGSKQASEIIGKIIIDTTPMVKDAVKLGLGNQFDSVSKELIRLNAALEDESLPIIELMEPYGLLIAHLMILKTVE